MSYVVQIWEQPADQPSPGSFREASKQLDELHERSPGQNARFLALARALTRRYPCMCSPESDELDEEEIAWSDGPIDGRTDNAVYGLGISTDHVDHVQPFVVAEARRFGLHVADDQQGMVYLADGRDLSVRDGQPLHPDELRSRVCELAWQALAPYGFAPRARADQLVRDTPDGWQAIVVKIHGENAFDFEASGQHREAMEMLNALVSIGSPEKISGTPNYGLWQNTWMNGTSPYLNTDGQFVVENRSTLKLVVNDAMAHVQKDLLPLLDKCTTLEGLVAAVCTVPLSDSKFFVDGPLSCHALAFARLTNHPQLQSMCREADFNTAHADYDRFEFTPVTRALLADIGEKMDWPMPLKNYLFAALPYIRTRSQIDALENTGPGRSDGPVVTDMGNGLFVSYVYERRGRWECVTHQQLADFRLVESELCEIAGINMNNLWVDKKLRTEQRGLLTCMTGTNMFEASILADRAYWEELKEISSSFIAAIPSREIIAICGPKDKECIAELRALVKRTFSAGGEHLLSRDLYLLWEGKWQVYK